MRTRLTQKLRIEHPIISAPMGYAAGGKLAAAVTEAGGLGLIGGGYGDAEWLKREFAASGNVRVGCGFITWSLALKSHLLELVLAYAPAAVMLSFGEIAPFAQRIKAVGALLICQVQTLALARDAVAAGADVIVAQGAEAGGHGLERATFTLVPEIADYLARAAPETALAAAGGYCTMAIWFDMASATEALWLPLITLTTKKSPITRVITKIEPSAMPVLDNGTTMSQMMRHELLPPSHAASMIERSMRAMELKMGTIMNSVNR